MKIVVCIKQVPDTTDVRIDPKTNTLIREGVASVINPFDMYAIEAALRLKESYGGTVAAVTMGPPQAEQALRDAISLGVDEAYLVSDRKFAGSDTWATSYTLASAIKKIGMPDVIVCGKQASDGDTAQVGPGIAAFLDIAQVTYVKHIDKVDGGKITVHRMTEEGYDVVRADLPVLLTVVKEIAEPRKPSLRGKMKAKSAKIAVLTAGDLDIDENSLGLQGSPTQVVKVFTPERGYAHEMIEGASPDELAENLVAKIEGMLR